MDESHTGLKRGHTVRGVNEDMILISGYNYINVIVLGITLGRHHYKQPVFKQSVM